MAQGIMANCENNDLVSEAVRLMSNKHGRRLDSSLIIKFVGILLVLRKNGAIMSYDRNYPYRVFESVDSLGLSSATAFIIDEVIAEVKNSIEIEKLEQIICCFLMTDFGESDYLRRYDCLIDELSSKDGLSTAPKEFALLVDAFLPEDVKSVYNPFGGTMRLSTGISICQTIEAVDVSREAWAIGMLRVELSGKANCTTYLNESVEIWSNKIYDAIIAMPPLRMKLHLREYSNLLSYPWSEEAELIAPTQFVESTRANGCCITFVSPALMWSTGNDASFRKWATENRYIDTIILLPKNLLSFTAIPVVCMIMRKNSSHRDGVRMIDASNFFVRNRRKNALSIDGVLNAYHHDMERVSATIPFEQIVENEYSWYVVDYLNQESIDCPDGYKRSRLDEIVTIRMDRFNETQSGALVQIKDLSSEWTHPYVDVKAVDQNASLRGSTIVTEDAVLLSTIRAPKPSIIHASKESPVHVSPTILVLIPRETVNAEYLCMALAKTDIPSVGMGAPHISKTRLLRQQIAYPSLEQQRSTYQEARHAAMLEQVKALHLEEVLDRRIADFSNEIRSRKHDMMPHLRQLSSARKNLRYYLTHKDQFSEEEFLGGMREEVLNQEKAIESLSELLSIFTRESKFGEPEIVNIDRFLMENYFDGDNYSVDFDTDYKALANSGFNIPDIYLNFDFSKGVKEYIAACPDYVEGINVYIAIDDLKRLCDNIVFNAIRHGFTDPSRKDYNIDIQLTVDQERDMFQIDFVNNGNPLPKGLDKLRYGLKGEKAGATAGTGEGGYIVRSITEHYGGDYDIFSETSDNESLTTVRVFLPIYRDNE